VLAATGALAIILEAANYPPSTGGVPVLVALYTETTRCPRRVSIRAGVATADGIFLALLSVMVVQAGAARRTVDRDAAGAKEAMELIESTGRQALDEMRRLLGVLRQDNDPVRAALAPQPSVRHLDQLVAQVREAGLPVELEVEGEPQPLASGVDLSAYRIVQEALTNSLKHAGPAHATVRVRYGRTDVEVVVTDDGRGPRPPDSGDGRDGGHGLVGMRERVALYGGELDVGPRRGGGFEVRARLPVAPGRL
jgi:signal transduction histidine kinase